MFGFIVILFMTPSGHSWIINKITSKTYFACRTFLIFQMNVMMKHVKTCQKPLKIRIHKLIQKTMA